MERAMAMSLSESQTLPGQETGITNHTAFGPATRAHYDDGKWDLMLAGTRTQEIILNPEPPDRKRTAGTPAFFKASQENYRLAAVVKALHEIPMAREALLNRTYLLQDYSYSSEWWDGTPIKVLKVVNVDQGQENAHSQDIVAESQRLMAFLDQTDRAYGNIDALASYLNYETIPEDKVAAFLAAWEEATNEVAPDEPLARMFTSEGLKRDIEIPEERGGQVFRALAVRIDRHMVDQGWSLYDAIDDMLWTDASETTEVFLATTGQVVILDVNNLDRESSGLGIDIPPIWYLDRWLESSIHLAKDALDQRSQLFGQQEKIDLQEEQLTKFRSQGKGAQEASKLLKSTETYLERTLEYRKATSDANMYASSNQGIASLLETLKATTERISVKLQSLEGTKGQIREQLKERLEFLTKPTDDPTTNPKHKYTLRGVTTGSQTTFVQSRSHLDIDDNILDTPAQDWQWWRLEYNVSDTQPVSTTKVTEQDVLHAARTSSKSATLIYASDLAMATDFSPLPPQLSNFIRHDNLSFATEINEANPLVNNSSTPSPGKRKNLSADSDSDDLITELPQTPPNERDMIVDDYSESPGNRFPSRGQRPAPATPPGFHRTGRIGSSTLDGHRALRPKVNFAEDTAGADSISGGVQKMGGSSMDEIIPMTLRDRDLLDDDEDDGPHNGKREAHAALAQSGWGPGAEREEPQAAAEQPPAYTPEVEEMDMSTSIEDGEEVRGML